MASIQSATPAMRELVRITAVQRPRADLDVWALYNDALDDFYDGSPVIAAARVIYSSTLGQYRYAVGALPGGTTAVPTPYTVALTCDVDDPMVDDTIAVVKFTAGKNADVVIGQTTTVDFAP